MEVRRRACAGLELYPILLVLHVLVPPLSPLCRFPQVHVDVGRGIAKCFSRAGEDSSFKYAEVSTSVQAAMAPDVTSVVLEGEAVAVDRNTGSILPFSAVASLSRGEKRRGAAGSATASPAPDGETSADTSVCLFVFDVLALNGKSVFQVRVWHCLSMFRRFNKVALLLLYSVQESLQARKALLQRSLVLIPGKYELARSTDLVISKDGLVTVTSTYVDDVRYIPIEELGREVGALMTAAVEGKCEGLMVKTLSGDGSVYLPGSRTKAWLKLKSDYEGMAGGDAMDVVPIGGYAYPHSVLRFEYFVNFKCISFSPFHCVSVVLLCRWRGKGKRKGLIGSFLVATYDPNSGKFSSLTKLGTGFTEADLETLSTCLDTVEGKPEDVTSTVVPDVWFKPAVV